MFIEPLLDTLLLFILGFGGWLLFKVLRLPVAALLGTIFVIGTLRALQVDLPISPPLLSPFVQVFLGIYVGTRVTKETTKELGGLVVPALIIVAWSVSIVFSLGFFLFHFTALDLNTGILSSSMGGLPEMTVIALETNADIAVVIVMQSFRMIATVIVFPVMLSYWVGTGESGKTKGKSRSKKAEAMGGERKRPARLFGRPSLFGSKLRERLVQMKENLNGALKNWRGNSVSGNAAEGWLARFAWGGFTLALAAGGAWLFLLLQVPAGAMVGSMVFIALASILGAKVKAPTPSLFGLMLVGVGIMVSDNISSETVQTLLSGELLLPLFFSTLFIFCSSFFVAFVISRTLGWDFPTSFLAAAPGGFTVMTSLAVSSGRNPFHVSMLHLCRLLILKTVVPLAFMFFL